MKKILVDQLTLSEIQILLSGRLQYEMEEAESASTELNDVLGIPDVPYDRMFKEKVAAAMGEIVAERIVYADPSVLEMADFEPRIDGMVREMEGVYGNLDQMTPEGDIRGHFRMMFSAIMKTLSGFENEPYMGYKHWLQSFLDISSERGLVPSEMVVDHVICDELVRRRTSVDQYRRNGLRDIEAMVNVDNYMDTMIRPFLESMVWDMGLPDEEEDRVLQDAIEGTKSAFLAKLTFVRDIMTRRLEEKIVRIYG